MLDISLLWGILITRAPGKTFPVVTTHFRRKFVYHQDRHLCNF